MDSRCSANDGGGDPTLVGIESQRQFSNSWMGELSVLRFYRHGSIIITPMTFGQTQSLRTYCILILSTTNSIDWSPAIAYGWTLHVARLQVDFRNYSHMDISPMQLYHAAEGEGTKFNWRRVLFDPFGRRMAPDTSRKRLGKAAY